jgi:hypothetical protein
VYDGIIDIAPKFKLSAVTSLPSVPSLLPSITIAIATPVMLAAPSFRIQEDPDLYQISNYKIQPTFTVDLLYALESSSIMKVELLDGRTQQIIQKAFVSGDLQPVVTDARY